MEAEQLLNGENVAPAEAVSKKSWRTVATAIATVTAVTAATAAVVTYSSSGRNAPAMDIAALGHKQHEETFGDDMYVAG